MKTAVHLPDSNAAAGSSRLLCLFGFFSRAGDVISARTSRRFYKSRGNNTRRDSERQTLTLLDCAATDALTGLSKAAACSSVSSSSSPNPPNVVLGVTITITLMMIADTWRIGRVMDDYALYLYSVIR